MASFKLRLASYSREEDLPRSESNFLGGLISTRRAITCEQSFCIMIPLLRPLIGMVLGRTRTWPSMPNIGQCSSLADSTETDSSKLILGFHILS